MAEVTLTKTPIWQVIEMGVIPKGEVVHGTYDDEGQAWAKHDQLLREAPALRTPGVLWVRARQAEVVAPGGKAP